MRRILFLIIILTLGVIPAWAFDWKHTNSVGVSWDPVTTYEDGTPLPTDAVIKYTLYSRNVRTLVEQEVITLIAVPTTIVTFATEGRFHLGVKAVRMDGEVQVEESTVSWSDNPLICRDGVTFGVMYFKQHKVPEQLRSP